jgi:hypothetical protein
MWLNSLISVGGSAWLIFLLAVYFGSTEKAQRKMRLICLSWLHLLFTCDRWYRKAYEVDETFSGEGVRRRVYFIRHAESQWNAMFNRGISWKMLWIIIKSLYDEFLMLPTGDSVFMDSPLSQRGIAQALQLRQWIESAVDDEHANLYRNLNKPFIIASSNLRRAISTASIGLSKRLIGKAAHEVLLVNSALQESTRNIDGISLLPEQSGQLQVSLLEKSSPEISDVSSFLDKTGVDGQWNDGNRPLIQGNVYQRFTAFNNWVLNETSHESSLVVCGHSLWLKEYMKCFLPKNSKILAKSKKISNCGILAFDLVEFKGKCFVDPSSVQLIRGSYEGVKQVE